MESTLYTDNQPTSAKHIFSLDAAKFNYHDLCWMFCCLRAVPIAPIVSDRLVGRAVDKRLCCQLPPLAQHEKRTFLGGYLVQKKQPRDLLPTSPYSGNPQIDGR